jgi:hypothetical protein
VQEIFRQKQELYLSLPDQNKIVTIGEGGRRDFGFEDFDEDDIAGDPYEDDDFDDYFDAEIASDEIDEAEEQIIEKSEKRLAA